MQGGRLCRNGERLVHRRNQRLPVLEVLDILRGRCQIVANLVRHGGRACQMHDKLLRRSRQLRRPSKRKNARAEVGYDVAALESRAYFTEHWLLLEA